LVRVPPVVCNYYQGL